MRVPSHGCVVEWTKNFCYNNFMKKILLCLAFLVALSAFAAEPLMIINPARETFVNFPSAYLGDGVTVTVFLPEPAVPLRGKYPVVYLLGAGPKDAAEAQSLLENTDKKAILVGVLQEGKAWENLDKISSFFSRELVPYIDTNYPTFDVPAARAVASYGAENAKVLAALLARKQLFARTLIVDGGKTPISLAGTDPNLRVLLAGKRAHVVVWQQTLEEMGLSYGPGFVTALGEDKTLFSALDLKYLFAPQAEVSVKKISAALTPKTLSLDENQKASLTVFALLKNGRIFDYVPLSLRLSPHYLNWNAETSTLNPISGAAAGKVKISVFVDKKSFSTKIKLKK